jgi:hypothetical protein
LPANVAIRRLQPPTVAARAADSQIDLRAGPEGRHLSLSPRLARQIGQTRRSEGRDCPFRRAWHGKSDKRAFGSRLQRSDRACGDSDSSTIIAWRAFN